MVFLFSAAAVLVTLWFALRSTKALYDGHRHTILFLILAHFFLYGLPIALDLTVGRPAYELFAGFYSASSDPLTTILFSLATIFCPFVWWTVAGPTNNLAQTTAPVDVAGTRVSGFCQQYRWTLIAAVFLPTVMLLRAPDITVYYDYAPMKRLLNTQPFEVVYFHMYLRIACVVSVIAACGVLLSARTFPHALLLCIPTIVMANWLIGKRAIVAISLTMLATTFWFRGILRGWRIIVAGGVMLISLLAYSFHYQQNLRGLTQWEVDPTFVYDSVRIDFGRDDVLKLAIYAELHPNEIRLMDYRGESLWIYGTLPIPRHYWPNKPLSYGGRMACEAMLVPQQPLGWGMTTSILDEAVANFGWLGFLLGPLVISFVCRYGDSANDGLVSMMTVVVGVFLLTLHLSATAPFVLLWLVVARLSSPSGSHTSLPVSQHQLALSSRRIG